MVGWVQIPNLKKKFKFNKCSYHPLLKKNYKKSVVLLGI